MAVTHNNTRNLFRTAFNNIFIGKDSLPERHEMQPIKADENHKPGEDIRAEMGAIGRADAIEIQYCEDARF